MHQTTYQRGQACFRMPKALYQMLFDMRPPGATPWEHEDCRRWLHPLAEAWGLIDYVQARRPHSTEMVYSVVLTDWGKRLASILPMQQVRAKSPAPHIPIVDLLAISKPEIIELFESEAPIPKSPGATIFEAMGVLAADPMGRSQLLRTQFLMDALQERGGGHDGPEWFKSFLTDEQAAFLRRCQSGVTLAEADVDGRSIKPLTENYMGLIEVDNGGRYILTRSMRNFSLVAMTGTRDHDALFAALPELDKVWLASELVVTGTRRAHTFLLHRMGWLYKKGREWGLSSLGRDLLEGWNVHLRGKPSELYDYQAEPEPAQLADEFACLDMDGPDIYTEAAADDAFDILDMPPSDTPRAVTSPAALGAPYKTLSNPCAEIPLSRPLPDHINPYTGLEKTGYPSAPPPRIDTVQGQQVVSEPDFDIL